MTRRLRITHVIVQPVLVWDDDSELAPGPPVKPFQVALKDLDGLAEKLRAELAVLAEQQQPVDKS